MPPSVPTRPAGGGSVAANWGQWVHDWLKDRNVVTGTSNLTLTTAFQDIAGLTMTLAAGWYIIIAFFDCSVGSAGIGQIECELNVDGVQMQGIAIWQPNSSTTGEGTVGFMWMINPPSTQIAKLRARKTISAGSATVVGVNSRMMVI